jgi:Gpi18-like mannosyltransferase
VSAKAGAAPAEDAVRLRDGLRTCLMVFLAVRIAFSLLSMVGVDLIQPRPLPGSGDQLPTVATWPIAPITVGWHNVVTASERQDAARFLGIATSGYGRDDASAAFFPGYPLAIRVVAWLPFVGPLGAALLVSNVAFVVALVLLHGLTRFEFGSASMGRRSILFLAVFPTAIFFLAPYSESLFLALSLWSFWAARRDRWGWAALAAALAASTRAVGLLLLPALAIEALHQWRADGRAPAPRLAAAAATAIGPALYLGYWALHFHDIGRPLAAQRTWRRDLAAPWLTLETAWRYAWRYQSYWLFDLVVVGVVAVALVTGIRWLRPSYLTYGGLSLLLPLCYPEAARPLLSMPRLVAVIFPAFWVVARAVERRRLPEPLVVGAFAGGYGIAGLLFINWWHIF